MISIGFLIGLVLVALWLMSLYNQLVRLRNEVKNSFGQIDIQLKRRYDLVPNLVETAKGSMAHERETLEAVIKARNAAYAISQSISQNPGDLSKINELTGAENVLSQTLGRFMAISESYPDLKANATMNQLMEELTSTENKISFARQAFNDSVMLYNNGCEMFPSSIIAQTFNFQKAQGFEITKTEERDPVKVSFK